VGKEIEELGYEGLEGLVEVVTAVLKNMTDVPIDAGKFEKLLPLVLEDARTTGEDMCWYAA